MNIGLVFFADPGRGYKRAMLIGAVSLLMLKAKGELIVVNRVRDIEVGTTTPCALPSSPQTLR